MTYSQFSHKGRLFQARGAATEKQEAQLLLEDRATFRVIQGHLFWYH